MTASLTSPRATSTRHRLTVGQRALWFFDRIAPDSSAYHVAVAVRIHGSVDVERMARAVTATVARHELLRSGFIEQDDEPIRFLADHVDVVLQSCSADSENAVAELVRAAVDAPFELAVPGLVRFVLVGRGPTDSVLVLAAHHIVTDAASQVIILDDLLRVYDEDDSESAPPKGRYDTFVESERELLDGPLADGSVEYWRTTCAGAPPALELLVDRIRPARKRYAGASHSFRLTGELVDRLRPAAAAAGVTPFVLLSVAFQALLYRHSEQSEFLSGYAVSSRPERPMRGVVGYFVNTLPCRTNVEPDTTFAELCRTTARQLSDGMAHRDCPLPVISAALGLPPDPSRTPVVQTMFSLVTATRFNTLLNLLVDGPGEPRALRPGGVLLSGYDVAQQEGQFDLSMEVMQNDTAVRISLKYDVDLYEPATVSRMAGHYQRLLAAAIDAPDTEIGAVTLLDEHERATVMSFGTQAVW